MKNVKAIVVGKNYNTSYGIINALGQYGYYSAVIKLIKNKHGIKTPEIKSKYVAEHIFVQNYNEKALAEAIKVLGDHYGKIVIIPADDFSVFFLDRNYDELSQSFIIPNIKHKSGEMHKMLDKYVQKNCAAKFGIKVSNSVIVNVNDNKFTLPDTIEYPCFTKPLSSVGFPKAYIKECISQDELINHLNMISENKPCSILVEKALKVKNEYTIGGYVHDGKAFIPAMIRKIKTGSGHHKGVTIIGEVLSVKKENTFINNLCSFVEAIGLEGIFDIEMIETEEGFFFNEINLRYGAAQYAVTAAGINLPGRYMDLILDNKNRKKENSIASCIFMNDKAALEDYSSGFCSWEEYRNENKKATVHSFKGVGDNKTSIAFQKIVIRTLVKKFINEIRR